MWGCREEFFYRFILEKLVNVVYILVYGSISLNRKLFSVANDDSLSLKLLWDDRRSTTFSLPRWWSLQVALVWDPIHFIHGFSCLLVIQTIMSGSHILRGWEVWVECILAWKLLLTTIIRLKLLSWGLAANLRSSNHKVLLSFHMLLEIGCALVLRGSLRWRGDLWLLAYVLVRWWGLELLLLLLLGALKATSQILLRRCNNCTQFSTLKVLAWGEVWRGKFGRFDKLLVGLEPLLHLRYWSPLKLVLFLFKCITWLVDLICREHHISKPGAWVLEVALLKSLGLALIHIRRTVILRTLGWQLWDRKTVKDLLLFLEHVFLAHFQSRCILYGGKGTHLLTFLDVKMVVDAWRTTGLPLGAGCYLSLTSL